MIFKRPSLRAVFKCLPLFGLLVFFACSKAALPPPLDTNYPTKPIELPRDLAAHDWAQTEWWYYTGHLQTADGGRYGFELTFFKRRTETDVFNGIKLKSLGNPGYMAHFAVVDERTGKYVCEGVSELKKYNLKSRAASDKFDVAVLNWSASGDERAQQIEASTKKMAINLRLEPTKPIALHGDRGVVPKGRGVANYYMSYTRMKAAGNLTFDGKTLDVTGVAWFDHEFGYLGATPVDGWDWFSLQLDDNTEYMIYSIRNVGGEIEPFSKACRIAEDGSEECIPYDEIKVTTLGKWVSPDTKAVYPSGWRIEAPKWGLDVVVAPTVAGQEFRFLDIAYWEGSCVVVGKPASGAAYVELVGYEESKIMGMTRKSEPPAR